MLWNNLKKILWLGLFSVMLLLAVSSYETLQFLNKAEKTQAVIVTNASATGLQRELAFVTANNTAIKFHSALPSPLINDNVVPVLYNPLIPSQVRIDNFEIIWSGVFWMGVLLLSLLFGIAAANYLCTRYQKKCKKLMQSGNHIYTKYQCVEALIGQAKDAAKGYQIITAWSDKSGKEHYFKSEKLNFNPMEFILDQTIKVMIDKKNTKRYMMDLSFLPKEMLTK